MKLLSLKLQNFKGIKEFELAANGKNVDIYGDNGAGKTTLPDAFYWLLSGKNSEGKADFEIKPLDADNNPIHNLETVVEGGFEHDGKEKTLKKVFKENWVRKRGQAQTEFTGHTIDYFVDGVPVKAAEYAAAVAEIEREDIFRLLTNPAFFNEQLKWQERRKVLIDKCGDMPDEAIIASDKQLAPLAEIIKAHSLEDHKKVLTARRTELNRELEQIPIRINEQKNSIPQEPGRTEGTVNAEIIKLTKEREAKREELNRILTGGEIAERRKQLAEAEAELIGLRNKASQARNAKTEAKRAEVAKLYGKIDAIKKTIPTRLINTQEIEAEMGKLRRKWSEENAKQFEGTDTCPTCNQPLPDWQVEDAIATFNRNKAENLKNITERGQTYAAELKAAVAKNEEINKTAEEAVAKVAEIEKQIQAANDEIETILSVPADSSGITEAEKKINGLKSLIGSLELQGDESTAVLRNEIQTFDVQIQELGTELASIGHYKKSNDRIAELEAHELFLIDESQRVEQELFLIEEFTRKKVSTLEEKVNSQFKFAKFKLFNQLINGGIEETCETLYGGVPYSGGLNRGHKIIVGLDIIKTLSEEREFAPPIFIDNAESVTDLPEMPGQVIKLIKPAIKTAADRRKYSKLVVEIEGGNENG